MLRYYIFYKLVILTNSKLAKSLKIFNNNPLVQYKLIIYLQS